MRILFILLSAFMIFACSSNGQIENMEEGYTYAKISTDKGDIFVKLYNSTPEHRDNFIKLAKEGFYDSTLFHRVMNEFMIQGGDPDSKNAAPGQQLGQGGPGYTLPPEFGKIHKKGALAAARKGDQVNPEKESSGSQFYIVHGRSYSPEELSQLENDMSTRAVMGKVNEYLMKEENKYLLDSIQLYSEAGNQEALQSMQDRLINQLKEEGDDFSFSEEQLEIYTSVGGAPFLDGDYTVFGEVVKGLEVVDSIATTEVNKQTSRPVQDIAMKVEIIE
ncbi:MAG TPA: peptidylprolyl isomerase [Saprospiraceae bacterium]|nr:peptidylprolyl isomerase [Saprospiraceae bacterium]